LKVHYIFRRFNVVIDFERSDECNYVDVRKYFIIEKVLLLSSTCMEVSCRKLDLFGAIAIRKSKFKIIKKNQKINTRDLLKL